jgi:hypothetical protein
MDSNSWFNIGKEVISWVMILLASFSGAWFAYRFQAKEKERDVIKKNISAANRAMFCVFQMLNSLRIFQKDFIDPCRERPDTFLMMLPVLPEDPKDFSFNFEELGFLLDTKYKKIMLDLFIEQQRYREAIKVINVRSIYHKNIVQPTLDKAGLKEGIGYPINDVKIILGQIVFADIVNLTDQVIFHVDRTLLSLEEVKNTLLSAFKDLFPTASILNIEVVK